MRQGLGKTIDEIWGSNEGDAAFVANNFGAALENLRNRDATLAALHPTTDAEKQALAAAKATVESIGHDGRVDRPVAIADVLRAGQSHFDFTHRDRRRMGDFSFFGYGLMSGGNAMSFVAVAVGALVVASAYLILDLSSPYSGIFRASSAPLEQVLAVMGKE